MVLHSNELIKRMHAESATKKQNLINVETCKKFITHFIDKRKTLNSQAGAYTLKCVVEIVHQHLETPVCITQKQFAKAAKELGFRMSNDGRFNMSFSKLKVYLKENGLDKEYLL